MVLACGIAIAADDDAPAPAEPAPVKAAPERPAAASSEGLREVTPELFYMEDASGRLVPVPGFGYQDFVDLFRMKEGLPGPLQPPAVVLENVVVRIDAREAKRRRADGDEPGNATFPAVVECTVRQARAGWAAVPLELGGLLLSAAPRHEGPGQMILDAVPGGGGYRAWFDAAAEAGGDVRHTVVLEGRIAGVTAADHEAFDLRLPVAVASLVEVKTRRRTPDVRVKPAAADEQIEAVDGGSMVALAGLAGAVRVRVADRREDVASRDAAAEAVIESTVRIDGRDAVTEATIRLSRMPADLKRVRITLPPRTTLRDLRPPASLVSRGGTADAPTLDVGIDVDAAGDASVELVCERPVDSSGDAPFEAVGFVVEGIPEWRQRGRVSLVVNGDWMATWADDTDLRRVDPPATLRQPGFVAAFAYDAQPGSLPVRVRPRPSRVVIEPEYRYEVSGSRITLDARFRVAVRGAPVGGVSIAFDPSWTIDDVGPAGAVDVDEVVTDAGVTVIPFTQSLAGDTVVEVRASRPIDKAAPRLTWRLPVPRADLVGPAVVVIGSESDIELLPDNEGIAGLVRQTAAAAAVADRTALVYRLDATEGSFAATRRFLPRRVEAAISASATVDASEIVVDETIRLDVRHVPLEFIELLVPTSIASGSVEVRQGDELLDPAEVVTSEEIGVAPDEPPTLALRAILAEPLLGAGDVSVRFRMPVPAVPAESTVAIDVPLAVPVAASIGRQTVEVSVPDAYAVGVRGDAWRRDVGPTLGGATQAWSALKPKRVLPLAVSARRSDAARRLVVEAAWLQTRLLPGTREDIRSYVISSADDRIVIVMPERTTDAAAKAAPGTLDVRLDGEPVPAVAGPAGRVVVDLPRVDPARRWRLDIRTTGVRDVGWQAFAARWGLPVPVTLEPPVFEGPVLERRFYWTVHVRPDEHVVGMPRRWTSQQRWTPGSWGWELDAVTAPAVLATWLDSVAGGLGAAGGVGPAAARAAAPPLAERSFVYSGVGEPGAATPWLMPDWFVVLLASAASLAAGLALVYRPAWRRPGALLAATAGLGVAAAANPDVAPLVGQAAVPGAGLAAIAWAVKSLTERAPRRPVEWPAPGGTPASSLTRTAAAAPSLIVTPQVGESRSATEARPR